MLRERLQLPETKTFEEYVDVDNEVQAHEELTEEVCIVISNWSFITKYLVFNCFIPGKSMKRQYRFSAITANYSGSREKRSSEVLLYEYWITFYRFLLSYMMLKTVTLIPKSTFSAKWSEESNRPAAYGKKNP